MPDYNGRPIITLPSLPPAPQTIDFELLAATSGNISPFTFQGQYYDWQQNIMMATVHLPPMPFAVAQLWVAFIKDLDGQANVFQLWSAFTLAYPNDAGYTANGSNGYWCLQENGVQWTVQENRLYYLSLKIRQAL
jgi:hypothetical protein